MLTKLLSTIEKLQEDVKWIKQQMEKKTCENFTEPAPVFASLPMTTLEDFTSVENQLDEKTSKQLVSISYSSKW